MKNINKMIKLDLISILPYFTRKNLLILIFLSVYYLVISKNPFIIFSIPVFFSILFASYPFLVGEEAGIDGLYKLLGINSRDVVIGRYVLSFILFILGSLIGILLLAIFNIRAEGASYDGIYLYSLSYFVFFILITCLTFPIYFKHGYTKAKGIVFIPFLSIGVIVSLVVLLNKYMSLATKGKFITLLNYMALHKIMMLVILALFLGIIIFISMYFSHKFYEKRDF